MGDVFSSDKRIRGFFLFFFIDKWIGGMYFFVF